MRPQLVIQTNVEDFHAVRTAHFCVCFLTYLFQCTQTTLLSVDTTVPLHDMIVHTLQRAQLHPTVAYQALILLQRFKLRHPNAQHRCGYRLFLTAYMLASKVICDDTYAAASWRIVSQYMFSVPDINWMERDMCSGLDYRLDFSEHAVRGFQYLLQNAVGPSTSNGFIGFSDEHVAKFEQYALMAPISTPPLHPSTSTDNFPPTPPLTPSSPSDEAISPDTPAFPPTPAAAFSTNSTLYKVPAVVPSASLLWDPMHHSSSEDDNGSSTPRILNYDHIYAHHIHLSSSMYTQDTSSVPDKSTNAPLWKCIPLPPQTHEAS